MENSYPPILGIDLGTTFCCVSIFQNGKPIIIPNELGERTTPSFISFFENGERLVGTLAKERIMEKQKIVFGSKRLIGRRYQDKEIQNDLKYIPFKIIENKARDRIKIKVEDLNLSKDEYHPEEISGMILLKLKKDAEFYLNQKELKEVVITTPAYFNQKQRISTKQAAEIAGLKVRKIINEPTAASIAYAYLEKEKLGNTNLILDFGGGTLDLTLLSFSKTDKIYCKILCSSGDTHLGGQDIDNIICEKILQINKERIDEFIKNNPNYDLNRGKLRLLKASENGKILLSSKEEALIFVDSFLPELNLKYILKRKEFEEIITDFFNKRIKPCINFFLKKYKLKDTQIEKIIFVGGSSKIPILKDLIQQIFKKSKILSSINPDEVVAIGAGIIAAQLNGDKNLDDLNLFDVTSLSLGTNVVGNKMNIIIPKSTPFPVIKKKVYFTTSDNQETIINKVYEGESENLDENYLLGDFLITGLTKRKARETKIELVFELTSNMLLKVKAKELNRKDEKTNEKNDKVKLEEPKGFLKLTEINNSKNLLKQEKENEWKEIYDKKYKRELIELKINLYQSSKIEDKYTYQTKVIKHIAQFLTNFNQTKFIDDKKLNYIYTLYVILFFIEINRLISFKKNLDFFELSNLIFDNQIEQKLEYIQFKSNENICDFLDFCNSNILFYNILKLKIIKLLFKKINDDYISINLAEKFDCKLINYKSKIIELEKEIPIYLKILENIEGNENLENEKNDFISQLKKFQKGLEIKKFIINYHLMEYTDNKKCEEYLLNYFDYNLEIESPEYIQLQKICKTLQLFSNPNTPTSFIRDEIKEYIDMIKECINGEYHGKQTYIDDLDRDDNEDDEDEKAFQNLSKQEQKIIECIYNIKKNINKRLDNLIGENKNIKQNLFLITKEIPRKKADLHKIEEFYGKNDIENLINYVKSIYTNNKVIRTMKDFEEKIIDDTVLSRINSIIEI